ncbi:hypothetical protein J3Q64DRAFT_1703649 [Phycomyces blakesleeanus]|uniref:C2H2-type zinc finger transcription factor n=1 Tax=Phycomyces blakesleeanus TaxID=4837 RepID=A0ABR3AJU8_PHYBL
MPLDSVTLHSQFDGAQTSLICRRNQVSGLQDSISIENELSAAAAHLSLDSPKLPPKDFASPGSSQYDHKNDVQQKKIRSQTQNSPAKLVIKHYKPNGASALEASLMDPTVSKYSFTECSYLSNSRYNFERHLERHSNNPSRSLCHVCPKAYHQHPPEIVYLTHVFQLWPHLCIVLFFIYVFFCTLNSRPIIGTKQNQEGFLLA